MQPFFILTLDQNTWLQILGALVFTSFASFVTRRCLQKLQEYKKAPEWIKSLGEAFYSPSLWLIWGFGLLVILQLLSKSEEIQRSGALFQTFRNVFIIIGATWVFMRWKAGFEQILLKRADRRITKANDKALIRGVGRIINAILIVIVILIVMDNLGIDISALLAVGGVGALTIGFAAKDVFANIFGGMMIYINRPFDLGDLIRSPNKNFEGVVEDIGWYMTRLRTLAREPIYIPNALMTDAIVENRARMYNRRIKETIELRYSDLNRVIAINQEIVAMLKEHPEIDPTQYTMAHLTQFGPHALEIDVTCFTRTKQLERWRTTRQDLLVSIANIVKKHGADFAFPTRTVYIQKED